MIETVRQIEMNIEGARHELSSHLNELEQTVRSAVDWRHYYDTHTAKFLGFAFGAGLLLSLIGRRRSR
ncbi:MAG TPA: hypothetical protein VGI65_16790 [Steroidobacteraceae bacterium]|jgi:hypothetical protein